MKKTLTYLSVILVFLGACNKELPPEKESSAVFYVKGNLDGKSVNFSAGDDRFYMFPSVKTDSFDIRTFQGVIGSVDCTDPNRCPQSIKISIRELQKGDNGRPSIDQNIQLKEYDLRGPASLLFESYKATFICLLYTSPSPRD